MIEIVAYLFGAWGLGWCFGFSILTYKKFTEVTISG